MKAPKTTKQTATQTSKTYKKVRYFLLCYISWYGFKTLCSIQVKICYIYINFVPRTEGFENLKTFCWKHSCVLSKTIN